MALNLNNVSLKITAGNIRQFPRSATPQIALAGRSNVGKSSLINTLLCRRSLARVSSAPGKTITVNYYDVDGSLYLVDLPGYGYAKRPQADKARWSELTDGYFTKNPSRDRIMLVLQLVDMRIGPTADDVMMLDWMNASGVPFAIAATKADKLSSARSRAEATEKILSCPSVPAGTPVIPFSSVTGEGRDELWRIILSAAGK
ncbi:MAG: ribosome biogenesis GTP-binding protein YihA/YsxC [Clostridiales bacterium]|nr:ribosome biogenesis GTP-binding protein YihA/YsxC [Clostridiales bacterium]